MSLLFVNFSTSYVETKLILCVVIVLDFIGGFLAISSIFLGTCLFTIHLGYLGEWWVDSKKSSCLKHCLF